VDRSEGEGKDMEMLVADDVVEEEEGRLEEDRDEGS